MRSFFLSLSLGILATSNVCKAEDNPALFGIWSGKIGDFPIVACLETKGNYRFGAYYYRSQLKAIHLIEGEGGRSWKETNSKNEPEPRWQLDAVDGNRVTGTWLSENKSLPIKLERMAGELTDGDGQETACGSDAFFEPRITPYKILETATTLDGQAYIKVTLDAGKQFDAVLETFKLKGSDPQTAAINQILLRDLPQPGRKPDYVECIQSALANGGNDGDYSVGVTPTILTPSWLVVNWGNGSYCGGAHPTNSSGTTEYDRRTGTVVDLDKWLAPASIDQDGKITGSLISLLEQKYVAEAEDNSECIESMKSTFGWGMSLSKSGIDFTPSMPYAYTACANPVNIGFESVAPFLNEQGKKKLADFRSELPK
jgi:hypothetical protein